MLLENIMMKPIECLIKHFNWIHLIIKCILTEVKLTKYYLGNIHFAKKEYEKAKEKYAHAITLNN